MSTYKNDFYCDNIDFKSIPEGLEKYFKINLFDYQKKSLNKMINIENGENILEIPQSISINFHDTSMFYDQVKGCIVKNETNSTITSRGP